MSPDPAVTTPEDEELARVLDEYLADLETGRAADPQALLARHPAIAGRLRACLSSLQVVEQALSDLSASPEPSLPPPPLSDFRILREIGRGGMGVVYEAEQLSLNRHVALKILPFAAALDPRQLQRFRHEAQAAAHLHHTNIVPIFTVGCERGIHYYSMQYIEGQTVAALIAELRQADETRRHGDKETRGQGDRAVAGERRNEFACGTAAARDTAQSAGSFSLSPCLLVSLSAFFRTVAQLGVQAAEALEHAHQVGIVHRDIKPANLLLDGRGNLWITDFGLARFQSDMGLTLTGDVVGTLRYMAPEQALAQRGLVDHRADIYALGMTLYELFTLRPAFDGRDRQELLRQIAFEEPKPPRRVNPAVPADLETIVLKAIGKRPEERYATAQELADDLRRFLEHRPIRARRPSLVERAAKWTRRHRTVVVSAVALLLLAVVGLACATVLIAREQRRTRDAYEAEARQRARAEENFRQARRAVDFFAQVSEVELADRPEAQAVRRKLLEAALAYYQDFIDQHADDPSIRAELAASQFRVASILEQIGSRADAEQAIERARAFHEQLVRDNPSAPEYLRGLLSVYALGWQNSAGPFRLLTQKSVQEELKLSEEQGRQVARLTEQQRDLFSPPSAHEDWRGRLEAMASQEKALVESLRPEQARRLFQIALQLRGPRAFGDPDVTEALGLTEAQKDQVRAAQDDLRRPPRGGGPRGGPFGGGPFGGDGRKPEPFGRNPSERLLQVLTAEQKARWAEMLGEPFQGEVRWGGPPPHLPWPDSRRRGP